MPALRSPLSETARIALWLSLAGVAYGQAAGPLGPLGPLARPYAALPQGFEVNRGQADPRFAFASHGPGYAVLLAADLAEIRLAAGAKPPARSRAAALRVRLLGANRRACAEARDLQPGKSNYFIGNHPDAWRTDIPQYGRAEFHQVYPGIDVAYYGSQRQLEYDWVVGARADPHRIRLGIEGADRVSLNDGGDLVLTLGAAEIRQRKPIAYQDTPDGRRLIECRYVARGRNRVGLEVAAYDRRRPLVVDPVLVFSTYYGGNSLDYGFGIKLDADGNIYVGGATASTNFNGKALGRAFNTANSPSQAAFIAKISPSGALIFAAYVAGTDDQAFCAGLAIDKDRNVYLAGGTMADDFPTVNPIQSAFGGVLDAFALEVSSSGDSLVYSTYLGGPELDYGVGIQVDNSGNAYVAGSAGQGFPLRNAEQPVYGGGSVDAFAAKIAPGGSLLYSTYIGGSGTDYANNVVIDSSGDLIAYGDTTSTDFPVPNAYQSKLHGEINGWFAKLGPDGALLYASYIGGSGVDSVRGAKVDAHGDLYIDGDTSSSDFPTLNPLQPHNGGGSRDVFIAELNPAWSALIFSTYWGGSGDDSGRDLELDPLGNVYFTGFTSSTDFPTVNPTQANNGGGYDAFLTKMKPGGSAVFFSTYLGGSGNDQAYGLAVDALGRAYLTGETSGGFPSVDPLQSAYGGGSYDGFVAAVDTCDFAFSPPSASFGLGGGNAAVTINTTPECGWTASNNNSWITLTSAASGVGPGSVSYSIAPNHGGSEQTGTITLGTQTFGTPAFSITQSASAPLVAIVPPALGFPIEVLNTTSASRTVTLTNAGSAQLGIAATALSGPNAGDFGFSTTCPTLPSLIAAGANCTVTATFTPTAGGPRRAAITVTDDAAGNPHQIMVTGVGTTASLVPASVQFLGVAVGASSAPQVVTLTNADSTLMHLWQIAITGTDAGDFSRTTACKSTLAAGAHCSVKVTFAPTKAGTRTASLLISDDGGGSPQAVPLSGTATAALKRQ